LFVIPEGNLLLPVLQRPRLLIGFRRLALLATLAAWVLLAGQATQPSAQFAPPKPTLDPVPTPIHVFGFRDFTQQALWDTKFLAVPDPKLAQQHLKALTAAPHWASSPEDYATALYVAARFKDAGLQTEIVPYSVLSSKPVSALIEAFDPTGAKILSGPTPERLALSQDKSDNSAAAPDPRILPGFNAGAPSGDITAPVVFANFGRLSDFQRLADLGISVKG
jgi:N-acetylated-alpha-linked acidic dipeptidase